MEIETVSLEDIKSKIKPRQIAEPAKCLFYRAEICTPKEMKFKICIKCHRCQVITAENLIPRIFDKIVGLAIMLMKTMGAPSSGMGAGGGSGAGSGGGGGK
jgi:hypothetical protein